MNTLLTVAPIAAAILAIAGVGLSAVTIVAASDERDALRGIIIFALSVTLLALLSRNGV